MSVARLVAVLGYSDGTTSGLHPVCATRISRAQDVARPSDVVLLSGWARGRRPESEARAMARAWNGHPVRLLVDDHARSTYGNAVATAAAARKLDVREVVLVTSAWHGRRASALVRAALRGSGRRLTVEMSSERPPARARLRELACLPLLPVQAALAGRSR